MPTKLTMSTKKSLGSLFEGLRSAAGAALRRPGPTSPAAVRAADIPAHLCELRELGGPSCRRLVAPSFPGRRRRDMRTAFEETIWPRISLQELIDVFVPAGSEVRPPDDAAHASVDTRHRR